MIKIDGTGAKASSLAENLTEYENRLKERFGEDLALEPETPQGQVAGLVALALTEIGEAIVDDANASNLDHASGVLLDSLGTLLDIRRDEGSRSVVTATLNGVAGTSVPKGSRAKTENNDEFQSLEDAVIEAQGVQVEFESVEVGQIQAASGDLTEIVTIVPGWETVTNAEDAVVGTARQTDGSYRAGFKVRTAHSSVAALDSLRAALMEAQATKIRVEENATANAVVRQLWRIPAHSVLIFVVGGSDVAITRAVENHRGMGVGTVAAIQGQDINFAATGFPTGTATFSYGETRYTGVNFSGVNTIGEVATLLNSTITGLNCHANLGYIVVPYAWTPNTIFPEFTDSGQIVELLGLGVDEIVRSPGPFVRPRSRGLAITATVTRHAGFPGDGLALMKTALTETVEAYGIGEQAWGNDLLCAMERIPGSRVTAFSVQAGGSDASGVDVPLNNLWTLSNSDIQITIT